jgi:protein-L-isoaspartate(D-aspartate) O-methyltransferase
MYIVKEERERLINSLIRWGYLRSPEIIEAFRKVPREEFVPEKLRTSAYEDTPLPIGHGQTISAPSMIAIMLESLQVKRGHKVLEIGTGSGYNAALLAELAGREGRVASIERIPELAKFGRENLRKTGYEWVEVKVGDGSLGYPGVAWDRILLTACTPQIPKPLLEQLAIGGKIGAPVGTNYLFQTWTVVEKREDGTLKTEEMGGCSFVPLVGKYGWRL